MRIESDDVILTQQRLEKSLFFTNQKGTFWIYKIEKG